jgi:hypothetical protein
MLALSLPMNPSVEPRAVLTSSVRSRPTVHWPRSLRSRYRFGSRSEFGHQRQSVVAGPVILGDLSIQDNIKAVQTLAEPLQVSMDNGAPHDDCVVGIRCIIKADHKNGGGLRGSTMIAPTPSLWRARLARCAGASSGFALGGRSSASQITRVAQLQPLCLMKDGQVFRKFTYRLAAGAPYFRRTRRQNSCGSPHVLDFL